MFKQITLDSSSYDVWEWEDGAEACVRGVATTSEGDDVRFTLCIDRDSAAFFALLVQEDLEAAGLGLAEETVTAAIEKSIAANAQNYYGPEITKEFINSYFE